MNIFNVKIKPKIDFFYPYYDASYYIYQPPNFEYDKE